MRPPTAGVELRSRREPEDGQGWEGDLGGGGQAVHGTGSAVTDPRLPTSEPP
ncbi:MAG: hypothetical protein ACRDYA_14520 [Egibacteraceae bacterium]